MPRIESYFKHLLQNPLIKIVGAETGIVLNVLTEMRAATITIVCLVLIDLFFGLLAAHRFRCITSWKFRDTVAKLGFYLGLVLISTILQVSFGVPWIKEAFIGLIVSTEILSILENVETNYPGFIPSKIMSKLGVTFSKKKYKKR